MKVTGDMIASFLEALEARGVPDGNVGLNDVRAGLTAALADVPEPGELVDDDAFYASVANDLAELEAEDPQIKALGDKVREAEKGLAASVRSEARKFSGAWVQRVLVAETPADVLRILAADVMHIVNDDQPGVARAAAQLNARMLIAGLLGQCAEEAERLQTSRKPDGT